MVKTYTGGLVSLATLAFSLPLLSLLGEYPEFFVSHKVEPEHLLVLVGLILFTLPFSLSLVLIFASLFGKRLRDFVQISMVIALAAIVLMPIFLKFSFLAVEMVFGFSAGLGIAFGFAYRKSGMLRSSLFTFCPLILILPLSFLLNPGIQDLAFPKTLSLGGAGKDILPVPVVMVIFDEFTINSVLNEKNLIDDTLYPNLYWFAQRSHWFRNATTVADGTAYAVPAILSGQYAQRTQPTYEAYPVNIFTLLQNSHTFNAHESASKLCPQGLCPPIVARQAFSQHVFVLGLDALILYAHIVVPKSYSGILPDISQGWTNFLAPQTATETSVAESGQKQIVQNQPSGQGWLLGLILSYLADDRAALWQQFLDSIPNTPQPSLNLIHILLPHVAFEYLPSGKNYGRQPIPGLRDEKWNDDDWAVKQAWQRHLLQLVYVDKLLGDLFETLRAEGLFEESLIILTADHGLSFKKGQSRRPVTEHNYMDILPVPLFVKLPQQNLGVVSDANVETVDILPTVVDLLNIPLSAPLEGYSVFDKEKLSKRDGKSIFTFSDGVRTLHYPSEISGKAQVISDRIDLFGGENDPNKLFAFGSDKHWVGQGLPPKIPTVNNLILELKGRENQRVYEHLDGPNYVSGTLYKKNYDKNRSILDSGKDSRPPVRLALAVNGEISAVTKTYQSPKAESDDFSFLVPESAYQSGQNRIDVFVLKDDLKEESQLYGFKPLKETVYTLTFTDDLDKGPMNNRLVDEDKNQFQVASASLFGFLDTVEVSLGLYRFDGWAADRDDNDAAYEVVLFLDGQYLSSAKPKIARPDVVAAYNNEAYLRVGYSLYAEMDSNQALCDGHLEIFAVSTNGKASRLTISGGSLSNICVGI
ncbi:MAG: hypothetical protein ACI9FB_000539 [Candidatus Azotimanducaceae bacterium]